ncbi:MAG TPA: LysR family transcriptional regulator [Aliidongia sp.]|nr:LysR family transcriptional regulator [Aliidongia sp.]
MRGHEYADLRAFVSIVEHGNFARAAAYLRISASTLSQIIRELEERLGVRLLNRTTRSVSLTDAGSRLLARFKPAMDEIEAAVEAVRDLRDKPAGTVRLHIPRAAAANCLEPLLGRFHRAYPEILLDIAIDEAAIDIVEAGFDVGVRLGELLEHDMVAVRLGPDIRRIAVAAPDYIARHGRPETPDDLLGHRCINWRQPGGNGAHRWEFQKSGQRIAVAVQGPLIVSHYDLALAAAVQGVGIALVNELCARALIESGRLVPLLESFSPACPGWHLCYPKQRYTPLAVRALVEFLRQAGHEGAPSE